DARGKRYALTDRLFCNCHESRIHQVAPECTKGLAVILPRRQWPVEPRGLEHCERRRSGRHARAELVPGFLPHVGELVVNDAMRHQYSLPGCRKNMRVGGFTRKPICGVA